ncbi:ferric reductase-like transmembrane domain-containing protein [Shimia sp. SDUM112013]|uniref:ferredoxin reductase family protein n=1 Tax=Shimia sp. SDUM112013 TaxID=3136160 RepID=UPI0032EEF98C
MGHKTGVKLIVLSLAYLAVVTLPLVLSWTTGGPPRPFLQELGSGLGILAFAMILVEFVLSGRFKTVSNSVGMDITMRLHQVMARLALGFAVLHPLFYSGAPAGGPRPWDPTRQLVLTTDFSALVTGILAYALLPTLVALAVFRPQLDFKYEVWRVMHGVGALVIALLLLHHTVYAGRYGGHPVMVWLWLGLTGVAVASLLHVYLLMPLWHRRHRWKVTGLRRLTPHQWELTLTPDGHKGLRYEAGQFAWIKLGRSAFSLADNPFSIASAPAEGAGLRFMIKELGDFTGSLDQVTVGTKAHVDGPYGTLSVAGRAEPGIALIGGGIGVAPLLGILRQMQHEGDPRAVRVLYGNREVRQIACKDALDRVDTRYVLSEPPENWTGETGMIDPALLDRSFSDAEFSTWLFVMCGPKEMMDGVEDHLIRRGTPAHRILSERFDYD